MTRQSVQSRAIRAMGYDHDTRTLEVEFVTGRVYQYSDVPEFLYRGFVLAGSKGEYFNVRINGRFAWREVS